jgi:glycosyltransferase involved in cell wall biosynthesis/peptidoglycan/xylan/chitin deacetylase (PgdA/CDA1 family)
MLLNRVYYTFKPYMPFALRMWLRRMRAKYLRGVYAEVWPIDQRAGATPPGWPGWPEGKQFSFVLTHDVEGQKGFDRVEKLIDLETKYGFRSAFNFVPIGEYELTDSVRDLLNRSGFEVGVHGLEHDGKLYSSKTEFTRKAARIRSYLDRWGAVGFRSPLMQHKLSWLHELGVEYDASTFDTDPFEPEPDGVRTIFPFWVPGPDGKGYVELPYSLVQDFTLFIILRETNIDVWKRKLDWVAEHGGMALLNTHPDYMCFDTGQKNRDEFPVGFYEEFLQYARQKYSETCWAALPRDVTRYYCSRIPVPARNTRRRICMLAYTQYEHDNRVRRYAEALAKRGDTVEVIALTTPSMVQGRQTLSGVDVYGIQVRDHKERHSWQYAWRLVRFLFKSATFLARRHRRVRYDLIHVHNMPDILVFAAWYPRLDGAKLILDIHDIVPELYSNKFGAPQNGLAVRILKYLEKASAAFVDHVIVSNDLWRKTLVSRSMPKEKVSVVLNHVDTAIFYRRTRTRSDDRFIVLFPGSFQWHQGLDIAIKAFARVKESVRNAEFHIYGRGSGDAESDLTHLASGLGLNGSVKFQGIVPLEKVPEIIANADLGVVPKRADSFGNEAYSTKIMEFMSQGLPVVVSRTKIDSFYFDDTVVRFFPSGDDRAMADAMLGLIENRAARESLVAKGYEYVERHGWDRKREDYFKLVDTLATESFGGEDTSESSS